MTVIMMLMMMTTTMMMCLMLGNKVIEKINFLSFTLYFLDGKDLKKFFLVNIAQMDVDEEEALSIDADNDDMFSRLETQSTEQNSKFNFLFLSFRN